MKLFILRHAIAVPRGTAGYRDDSRRPLTKEGITTTRRGVRGMRRLKLDFDLVLSSPYRRAKHTAEIVVRALGIEDRLRFTDHLAAEAAPRQLVAEIQHSYAGKNSILLVGHEPYLTELVSLLLGGKPGLPLVLKKGGLCKLEIGALRPGPCARLLWWLTPRQLVLLGKT